MGISAPNKLSGIIPKLPAVSTTSGRILCGNCNIYNSQLDHFIWNGSNIPVAEALETSVICFPAMNEKYMAIRVQHNCTNYCKYNKMLTSI